MYARFLMVALLLLPGLAGLASAEHGYATAETEGLAVRVVVHDERLGEHEHTEVEADLAPVKEAALKAIPEEYQSIEFSPADLIRSLPEANADLGSFVAGLLTLANGPLDALSARWDDQFRGQLTDPRDATSSQSDPVCGADLACDTGLLDDLPFQTDLGDNELLNRRPCSAEGTTAAIVDDPFALVQCAYGGVANDLRNQNPAFPVGDAVEDVAAALEPLSFRLAARTVFDAIDLQLKSDSVRLSLPEVLDQLPDGEDVPDVNESTPETPGLGRLSSSINDKAGTPPVADGSTREVDPRSGGGGRAESMVARVGNPRVSPDGDDDHQTLPGSTSGPTAATGGAAAPAVSRENGPGASMLVAFATGGFLAFAAALYHRIRGSRLLEDGTRQRIYEALDRDGAIVASRLASDLGLNRTTVTYHLRKMAREGIVHETRKGRAVVWLRRGTSVGRPELAAVSPRALAIREAVERAPGGCLTEYARALGCSASLVHYHLQRLAADGLVRVERQGTQPVYHPGPRDPPAAGGS